MDASLASMYANLFAQEPQETKPVTPVVDFNLDGSDGDRRRLAELINRICDKSPYGKSVLEKAAQTGCTLMISSEMNETTAGTANRDNNIIYLNRHRPDEKLVTTLIHESRHVCQFANGCAWEEKGQLDILSQVMQDRAMEADADAAAGLTAFQMAQNQDEEVLNSFAQNRPTVASAIHCQMRNAPQSSENDLMEAAFKGWYSNDGLKKVYEDSYYCKPVANAVMRHGEAAWTCDMSLTPETVAARACLGGYLTKPSVLKSTHYADLNAATVQTLDKFFEVRKMRCGIDADESYKKCAVRGAVVQSNAEEEKPEKKTNFLTTLLHHGAKGR